ncbi:nitric oxide synthase [Cryobacterium frigoriphilum]|uniref:Nitric oxide synthase n=1 Tax=Cryobacterium frigoriphilum TaxID=1259150 RepID=A0A4R9A8T1_9MICO|nr:flavodoxin domain-containing protein [Cryobacterium frigoriphilum]TFD54041.1 nitric oxide synthase [Cryobacterium frigoriphilum]
MTRTIILFGTESGNAEMVAEDLASELGGDPIAVVADMTDFDIADFTPTDAYIVVCSTHGDGELPSGARPLFDALQEAQPSLAGIRYSIFGLGDRSYETYSHGSEIIDEQLRSLGAERVGVYGRHDASDGSLPNDDALEWMRAVFIPA